MPLFHRIPSFVLLAIGIFAAACGGGERPTLSPAKEPVQVAPRVITYEEFGAVGDGVTDDLPAIVAAHAFANENKLHVRTKPDAVYHLGTRNLTAVIQTDTDWNTSRFIVDDSQGVQSRGQNIFRVTSRLQPASLRIDSLASGQQRIEVPDLALDLFVVVENSNKRIFIRRGNNANSGTILSEAFILRRDGSIEGGIDWDYETVTKVTALPIDPEPLVLRGGVFQLIANQAQPAVSNYWARNVSVQRSNTVVDGIKMTVSGEGDHGQPYVGSLYVQRAAHVTLRNCEVAPRKFYQRVEANGQRTSMGTYGVGAAYVANFTMQHCRMDNIQDTSRWGVIATNFMKNVLIEDSVLSRMDVHQGVSGHYTIRRTTLGHQGLLAVGRGLLLVEDSEIRANNLIGFRPDYGSTWTGEVVVRNSHWVPTRRAGRTPAIFGGTNDGMHNFGYPTSMPTTVTLDGLVIDDGWTKDNPTPGVTFFEDIIGGSSDTRPFAHRLTEKVSVRNLTTSTGVAPKISTNGQMNQAIPIERF
jgi:hypothetical protein